MADPYYAEIRAFGFNFPPVDWAYCNGQQVQVQQNPALFAILYNLFGGNAQTVFNLPNLQGQAPIHWGPSQTAGMNIQMAQATGTEAVTLNESQMPNHTHQVNLASGSFPQLAAVPASTALPSRPLVPIPNTNPQTYASFNAYQNNNNPDSTMAVNAIASAYAPVAAAHENRTPYLVMNFCICLSGNWPPKP